MSKIKNFWKIFNSDRSVVILTYVPKSFRGCDGVYPLMKQLQKIYGKDLCGTQLFDERFDDVSSFSRILRTGYNLDGTRLVCAHLFDYNPKTNTLSVDGKQYKLTDKEHGYIYRVKRKSISTDWDTFRRHIIWTMGDDACWTFWGDDLFGMQDIISLDFLKSE